MTRIFPRSIPNLKQHSFFYSLSFYLKSSLREARRRKVYFILALLSTLIVVAATAVSQTIIEYTPLIFLKLSETNAGAIDTTVNSETLSFVENDGVSSMRVSRPLTFNTTNIHPIIDSIYPGSMTPRYTFPGSSFKVNNTKDPACNSTTNPPYNNCSSFTSDVVLQNTQMETELGMAPAYPLPNAIPFGTIIISEKLASSANLAKGDKVTMVLDVTNLLRDVCLQFNSHQSLTSRKIGETKFNRPALAYIPVTVGDVVGPMAGKFPQSSSADPVIMEYTSFFVLLAENMPKVNARTHISYASYTNFLKNENPLNYAGQILFNMKDRQTVYKNSNFDKIQDEVVGFSSEISEALGVFPFTIGMPVYNQLKTLKFAGLFLGIALNIIVVILFLLSVILIYNILLVTVETKTFEFGVIRMVGLTKIGIAQMILVQALLFVIPGIIAGLTVSVPLLKFVGQKLHDLIQADIPMFPTGEALFWSIFIGLIIPVISSYYPMKAALSKDLGSTLDLARSKTSAVQISIEITGKRFPWASVTFGILSIVFGIAIYILLPKSLLSFDAGLLLAIFFVILLGLLIGLALLSLNFQHTMEKLLTMIFFFWTNSSFKALIQNNLAAHKLRNRQTAIMYSLALGFIIFIVVSLRQQLGNMVYQAEAAKGADFQITVSGGSPLDYVTLDKTIQANLTHAIESYAWITQSLASFVGSAADIEVTNKGKLYSVTPKIRGVSVNIFKTVKADFTKVDECDENTGLDLGEQLYTPRGSQGVIVGSTYKSKIGVSTDIHDTLLVVKNDGIYTTSEELRVLATMDSAAGFTFSNLPSVTSQDMLVSLPTFMRLANNMTNNQSSIPITRLVIKVKDGKSKNADMIYKEFTHLQKNNYSALQIWDLRDEQKSLETNQNAISLIFNSVEIVAMILSMFSLISSMTTNIMQQTKEIAVMRAVGFSKIKVNLIYVSEAFILVISSALFGVLIGTAVAWILASQSVLFSQLPMFFSFPGNDCLVIFIAAIISAFLSAYLPAHRITKLPIAKIIRLGS